MSSRAAPVPAGSIVAAPNAFLRVGAGSSERYASVRQAGPEAERLFFLVAERSPTPITPPKKSAKAG